MENERWQRTKRLFDAARALDADDRASFLKSLVDSDVRKEVKSLLDADEDSGHEPDSVTADKFDPIGRFPQDANPPERIGPYRIVRQIGEGGMGVVYEAEQQRPVRRKLALKLIKWGMDTKRVIARFESERQALALMNHPNIASVHDAGATEEGRPYFAMEYVKGIPITEYCDKNRLTLKERLEVFIQVCDGVQHAHQKGIIHRDIKPSNVLVGVQDEKLVPKIIDFGVAKATSQRLTEHTVATELGQLVGTPEYMSPEQAEMTNLDIDTRTDVYSLGVLLYELLVGAQPFDGHELRRAGLAEVQRKLREDEPPRPSSKVSSLGEASSSSATNRRIEVRNLERELKGDLDWITMKALEKDRTRRYETANAMGLDLQRYLSGEPVRARPPTASYRLSKFLGRHRIGVTVALVALVATAAAGVLVTVGMVRATRAERLAAQEAAAANEISDFLAGLFAVSDPRNAQGESVTAREILDRGAAEIREKLGNDPIRQARLMTTMGDVFTSMGIYEEARPLLEEALAIQRESLGSMHVHTAETTHRLADLYWFEERLDRAEPLYLRLVEIRESTLGASDPATLKAKFDLGSLHLVTGSYEEGLRLTLEALQGQRAVLGDEHPDTLSSLHNLSSLYYRQERYTDAEPIAREVLETRKRIFGDNHPGTLDALHNLGTILHKTARFSEAESSLLAALDGKLKTLGESHTRTVDTRRALGDTYRDQSRFGDAENQYLVARGALDENSPAATERRALLTGRLVELYEAWGKPEKATEYQMLLRRAEEVTQ